MRERMILYAVSFLTNAAILIFEIAGGRLLAPYLGTSVEVWAGTIAVVLGGMALGYHLGGMIGDKTSSKNTIVHFLFGAGLAALIAWSVRDLVPTAVSMLPLPLTISALVVGAVLYMPTVLLLAIVSPLIAKNLIKGLDTSARVVGTLNAVGTVGSITGALLTGLVLIPMMGVDWIVLSVALLIFALALIVGSTAFFGRALILLLFAVSALFINAMPTRADSAIADLNTAYSRILIDQYADQSGAIVRTASTDPYGTQCAMRLGEGDAMDESALVFRYLRGFENTAKYFLKATPAPRVLFLGGCNYSYPRAFLARYPETEAHVVEIDPGMTAVAEEYFDFDPLRFPTLSITHEDARMFLNRHTESYDIIFMDVFGSSSNIPAHLTTAQTFSRLLANLAPNGVVAVNIINAASGFRSEFTASLLKTARTVFPHAEIYAFPGNPENIQNVILIASEAPLPALIPSTAPEDRLTRIEPQERGIVLTDMYAPVEYLSRFNRQ